MKSLNMTELKTIVNKRQAKTVCQEWAGTGVESLEGWPWRLFVSNWSRSNQWPLTKTKKNTKWTGKNKSCAYKAKRISKAIFKLNGTGHIVRSDCTFHFNAWFMFDQQINCLDHSLDFKNRTTFWNEEMSWFLKMKKWVDFNHKTTNSLDFWNEETSSVLYAHVLVTLNKSTDTYAECTVYV